MQHYFKNVGNKKHHPKIHQRFKSKYLIFAQQWHHKHTKYIKENIPSKPVQIRQQPKQLNNHL